MGAPLRLLDDLISLFYPRLCLACSRHLPPKQQMICVHCRYKLPKTNFHLQRENPFTERFWGRLDLTSGAALYHFTRGGLTQQLIHKLKYQGQWEVGYQLGELYGNILKKSPFFEGIDVIVPVPLHPKKEHQRGYNQSDSFAKGIAEALRRPWMKNALKRSAYTDSQTTKSRLERLKNVLNVFSVHRSGVLEDKHVLLVDDVLTTGATLEACGIRILEVPGTKLSMATIAIADY